MSKYVLMFVNWANVFVYVYKKFGKNSFFHYMFGNTASGKLAKNYLNNGLL